METDTDVEVVATVAKKMPNVEGKSSTMLPIDIYQEALQFEEVEVAQRSGAEDQQHFLSTCSSIKTLMKEVLALKTAAKSDKVAEEIEARRVKVMLLILNMRKLSRTQKVRVRVSREKALEERQSVDAVTLQLQGLLYEVLHLQKEAQRCLLAHTADKEIELLPLEQFYQQAPDSISRPQVTLDDPHQQRLARLHWELEQRRSQTTLCDRLTQDQQTVQRDIETLQTKLASLAPRINTILQATVPLQEALDLPLSAMRKQQEAAQLLPMPLYTLWMQTSAYSEAGDPLVCCIVRGDMEAARQQQCALDERSKQAASGSRNDNDSDNEAEDGEESSSRPRSSRTADSVNSSSSKQSSAALQDPIKQMLALHPLNLEVTVSVPEGNSLVMQFYYATELRIVTTRCLVITKTRPVVPGAIVLTDVLSGMDFLDCLYPEDTGVMSPNPATAHQLERLCGGQGGQGCDVPVPPELGRAYKWAQQLAGLAFPALRQGEASKHLAELAEVAQELAVQEPKSAGDVNTEYVHVTLSAIRRRLRARLALQQELLALQSATSSSCIPVPPECIKELFPGKVSSELVSWRPITWRDYSALPCTTALIEAGLTTERFLCFKALYQRKHVDMVAYVSVSPDYPQTVPLFSLELKWGENPCPSSHVQQLEAEVNLHWPELLEGGVEQSLVLPLMLYRLAVCLDVYTEAVSARLTGGDVSLSDSLLFPKEKIFFRSARGPDRSFPLKYLPKLRVFAQR